MGNRKFRWRVTFTDGTTPPRDVIAATEEGAKQTAVYAERVTGNKSRRLKAKSAEKLFAVGWHPPEAT